ncbi:ATP-binding protein [Oceanobacillus kapialis]|uniref:HD domain-containing protein n=1 Tax=Oceanobacillus kapialis TaxID=481353 RepID=UPI0038517F47
MKDLTIETLGILQIVKEKNEQLYNNFLSVYRKVEPLLNNRISMVFPYYTMHDVKHSFRIMNYMEKLIPDIDSINEFELLLLAYSALLHDVGMAVSEDEIIKIEKGDIEYREINYDSVLEKFEGDKTLANQEYIRKVHAIRSAEFIKENLKKDLILPNMPSTTFETELALICQSHTEDINWIKENISEYSLKGDYSFNSQFCAVVLRLADILDFDSQRTPPVLYDAVSPKGISNDEWVQHFSIDNTEKIKQSHNGLKFIELHGRCKSPYIHRKILSYIEWINEEINNANDLTREFSEDYRIMLHPKVFSFIESEGYTISDMKFSVNYNQITQLLMGHNLYGDKVYGLRELIQNSIDACNLKKEILDKKREFGDSEFKPEIKVILDKSKNKVIVKDNGMGMDLYTLKNYFLRLGASFYSSDDYKLKGYKYDAIGNYGIGFLASFMMSDEVTVKTRPINGSILYQVDLSKYDEFVTINENTEYVDEGTEVILKYDQFIKVWEKEDTWEDNLFIYARKRQSSTEDKILHFLSSNFITDNVDLIFVNKVEEEKIVVKNLLYNTSESHKNFKLNKYLNNIDGQVTVLGNINNVYTNKLENLHFKGEPIIFDGENLFPLDENNDSFHLIDFLTNDRLTVLNFPIVEDRYELEDIMKIFDNPKEAMELYIDRFDPSFITIIAKEEIMDNAFEGYVDSGEDIIWNLNLDDFSEYGLDKYASTFTEIEEKIVYNLDKNNVFLSVEKMPLFKDTEYKLFVRNVFVQNVTLNIPFRLKNLHLKDMSINIINPDVIPNITRNSLQKDDLKEIQEAIYIAICLYIHANVDGYIEKQTILGFLNKYHDQDNKYIKEKKLI